MSANTIQSSRTPLVVLKPPSGWAHINLAEMWHFRDLLYTFAYRDVKLRYRQTALGAIWVLLQPLMAAGIMSFVFGKVAGLKSPNGIPYFAFAFAGQLGWNLFSSIFTRANSSLLQNAQLVSKVYFPRMLMPLSTVCSACIDFLISLGMMVAMMFAYHIAPHANVLLLPLWVACFAMLALGAGFVTSALMVSYRDVQYVVPVLVNFLMFASPVAYSLQQVHEKVLHHSLSATSYIFYTINPLSGLLEGLRWSLLGTGTLALGQALYSVAWCAFVFFAGALAFRRMEAKFADVI